VVALATPASPRAAPPIMVAVMRLRVMVFMVESFWLSWLLALAGRCVPAMG
jgi:hypothetical protein